MNKITQYIPNFVTTDVIPEEYEFDTIEQLLSIEFVKKWSSDFDFYRYSQDISSDSISLMCEGDEGKYWRVIGYLTEPVDLPEWKARHDDDNDD